jgi:uncharacterized protein
VRPEWFKRTVAGAEAAGMSHDAALQDGGNQHFEVDEIPGLNHLFQHAKTGAVGEYGQIEETFAPEVEKIAAWILRQP